MKSPVKSGPGLLLPAGLALFAGAAPFAVGAGAEVPPVVVGSKAFPESWILGEAVRSLMADTGTVRAEHRSNLGGTEIVYGALRSGGLDLYPEYTGTIAEVLMKAPPGTGAPALRAFLAGEGLGMSDPLGFNDGYALAVGPETSNRGIEKISDLTRFPDLRLGFTHEFLGRKDGWPGLAARYGLPQKDIRGLQHELAYEAIATGQIDLMDIYTTDAHIPRLGLRLLRDDLGFFPRYDAVLLYRLDLPLRAPEAFQAAGKLAGRIDEAKMVAANVRVALERWPTEKAAARLLEEALGGAAPPAAETPGAAARIARDALRHLELVAVSLLGAILIGVPLGILAARSRLLAAVTLSAAGLLQTIPSLALLAFLIPLFGIGVVPALVALFLYSLLPIVRNTYTGLRGIPPNLREAAEALGLPPAAQLFRVKLPLASPAILAGIKTSAVINVGTATLAALIGAQGLGNPIMSGIALRDTSLILQGAVPAAILALLVQWGFDLLERILVPRGLRLSVRGE